MPREPRVHAGAAAGGYVCSVWDLCVRVGVILVHGAGVVLLGSFGSAGLRAVLQGELSKGWILFAGLTPRVFLTLSVLRLAKLLFQGPFPDDLFFLWRNV